MIKKRQKGIFSWYGYDTPIRERFKKIKNAGFDSTMLWWGDDKAFFELDKDELIIEALKAELIIENIHVPFLKANDIWSEDDKIRNELIARYKEWLNDCSYYNVPLMVVHISKGYDISEPNAYGIQSIEALLDEAEKLNVKIALENTRNNYLLEYLMEKMKSDKLGICYDTSHAQLFGDKDFNLLDKFKEKIFCFHISDNDGIDDKHWNIGKGVINWEAFIDKFPLNYKDTISLEVTPQFNDELEDHFLQEAYKSIDNIEIKINNRK